ncbi:class I SAM-dependent methyltransferase [Nisaea denitrificans]|uniref:class I SAM-dependent methyltransferase n=1 Tax=Nisaea denitrificans TaxID=390877 RepID=UPI00040DAE8B|nr:class I SAM-dependent methyltransferase [Nisaea denitrificans]
MGDEISTQAPSLGNLLGELLDHGAAEAVLFAVLLLSALSILYYTVRTGVPPMPSHPSARQAIFRLIPENFAPATIYELGCGWGGIAFALAARYPQARVVALELSPVPWLVCQVRRLVQRRPNLEIRRKDFMKTDLSDGDLVFCYLMVTPMRGLERKLIGDLRPGSVVITSTFAFPDWTAETVETVPEATSAQIYRYRVPG